MRGPAYASRSGPPLAGVGGGATRLPWRLAVFVLPAAGYRGHGHSAASAAAVPAEALSLSHSVAAGVTAAGEGGGTLQKLQLSDVEDHR